jgi:protein SCO1/2
MNRTATTNPTKSTKPATWRAGCLSVSTLIASVSMIALIAGVTSKVCAASPSPAATTTGSSSAAPAAPKAGAPASAFDDIATEKPDALKGLEVVENLGKKIPLDVELLDHQGKPVKIGDWFNQGKPVVIAMVYYRCPMLCKMVRQKLSESIDRLDDLTVGKDFNAVVVGFDPSEKPELANAARQGMLGSYGRYQPEQARASKDAEAIKLVESIEKGFAVLATQSAMDTRRLADALGFAYRYLPESNEFSHGSVIFVLSPDGTISRYLYGIEYPARNLRLALIEASQGKVGSTLDRVMMWCYMWDPNANSYVMSAVKVMRVGGTITMTIVFGVVGLLWVGERRKRRALLNKKTAGEAENQASGVNELGLNAPARTAGKAMTNPPHDVLHNPSALSSAGRASR